jgi:membrane protein YdbS with pleckstrin-like domain
MKNEDTWVFAHKYAGSFYWKWGWVVLVFAIIFMLFILGQSVEIVSTAGCILMFLQLIPLIAVIPHTEKALHHTFDKDGKRKDTCV